MIRFIIKAGLNRSSFMTLTWQDITTAGIVLAAVVYLAYCLVRWIRRKGSSGCGYCQRCSPEPPDEPLVQIEQRPK